MRSRKSICFLLSFLCLVGLSFSAGIAAGAPLRLKVTAVRVNKKSGSVNKNAIKRIVRRNIQKLKGCVKNSVNKQGKKYSGWLWLSFDFKKSGTIKKAAANSTITNKFAMKCIKMHMKRWKVTKGGYGSVTATVQMKK